VVGAGVDEEEEVVADQLHAVDGVFDAHPLRTELLGADHDRRVVRLLLVAGDDRDLARRDSAQNVDGCRLHVDPLDGAAALLELRTAGVLTSVDALVLRAAQLLAQLVDREVEGGELVTVGGFGPHHGALAGDRQLDGVVLDATVLIGAVRDLYIDALSAWRKVFDAGGLVFDDRAEAIGDTHSHADDAGFHP
jgi:hypothetical protein